MDLKNVDILFKIAVEKTLKNDDDIVEYIINHM
jgi:hypothetical protein